MNLLILGGSSCQLNAIKRSKEKGHVVIVSDYYEDCVGKNFCDIKALASTFDIDATLKIAKDNHVDGIMTVGTDQPILTCAFVSESLNLPFALDSKTAKSVTNKEVMKKLFAENNIPTLNFAFIEQGFSDDEIAHLRFPIVLKPLDSQGQRGIFKLDTIESVRNHLEKTLSFSREKVALIEEYYPNDEITISGWVVDDHLYILTITDRLTQDYFPHIGISTGHMFPTKYFKTHSLEIQKISEKIVKDFNIHNGPIYFQMLIGDKGIMVNEIACRIGGAYEDLLIPLVTKVDLLDILIDTSLGIPIDTKILENYDFKTNNQFASVQLLFAKEGTITCLSDFDELKKYDYFISGGFNFKPGDTISKIVNATQRAGYMIITGSSLENLNANIREAFKHIKILDADNENLLIPCTKTN